MPASIRKTDQAEALLRHARDASPFLSNDGEPCVSVPASIEHRTIVPLRSALFRDWLTARYYSQYETPPSSSAFRAALRTLEARARYGDFPKQRVANRLGFEGDPFLPTKIMLDLANAEGEVLEITSRGCSITNNLRTAFRQSSTTLPLPRPHQPPAANHQPLADLSTLFRLSASQYATAFTWLTAALRPTGPYPILVLNGPTGSGKTLLARALRALIDPAAAPVHRLPARDRDLLQLAFQNWILVFDLVHRVPHKISESLCAISSGDALEINQTDLRDPLVIQIARPMILIVPQDETQPAWTPTRTLANRTFTIQLQSIAQPRPEAAMWADFETLHPAALGALGDAAATALRRIRDIDLGNVPRFPDCATWTAAAAPALGLDESAVVNAFSEPDSMWVGGDPLREAVHALLKATGTWTGEPADLLNQLRARAPLAAVPSTPKGLSQALPRVAGIHVTSSRRTITIARLSATASEKAATNTRPTTPNL